MIKTREVPDDGEGRILVVHFSHEDRQEALKGRPPFVLEHFVTGYRTDLRRRDNGRMQGSSTARRRGMKT